jgi:hypothetical protein
MIIEFNLHGVHTYINPSRIDYITLSNDEKGRLKNIRIAFSCGKTLDIGRRDMHYEDFEEFEAELISAIEKKTDQIYSLPIIR